jgi:hypothetical protein
MGTIELERRQWATQELQQGSGNVGLQACQHQNNNHDNNQEAANNEARRPRPFLAGSTCGKLKCEEAAQRDNVLMSLKGAPNNVQ